MSNLNILNTPVLLTIFRRPDTTQAVLDRLSQVRPRTLLVAADGPRNHRPGEADLCEATRKLIDKITWCDDIRTTYSDMNMGLRRRMASAITWAFENFEEAIILEDDCVPDPSFFRFCHELLEQYRNDNRIMAISGDNFQTEVRCPDSSYYFSRYPHCWGWATWRRAWRLYDDDMKLWPLIRDGSWLHDILQDTRAVQWWRNTLESVAQERIDSWATRWTFACWVNSGLTVLPNVNLVRNIGFNSRGTNTVDEYDPFSRPVATMTFPLRQPPMIVRDAMADTLTERRVFSPTLITRAYRRFQQLIAHALPSKRANRSSQ